MESQEEAVSVILGKKIQPGEVLVVRYEGPAGGPGMQEMLHPTAFLKGAGLGKKCALITDGRFSGASRGFIIGASSFPSPSLPPSPARRSPEPQATSCPRRSSAGRSHSSRTATRS